MMNAEIIIYQLGLLFVVYLIVLNGYLRGNSKHIIDAVLSVIIVIAIILGFILFNWKVGAISVIAIFVYAIITRPLARKLAYRMVGYRTSSLIESDNSLSDFSSGKISLEKYFEKTEKRRKNEENKLRRIYDRKQIKIILQKNNRDYNDFVEFYRLLNITGLGEELAWEIISDPKKLQRLISLKNDGATITEISSEFMRL